MGVRRCGDSDAVAVAYWEATMSDVWDEPIIEVPTTHAIETGIRWACLTCNHRQEPIEDEEWPYHCGMIMKMQPWYRLSREAQP